MGDDADFSSLRRYDGHVDALLFDTRSSARGGTGTSFNWRLLDRYDLNIPFWLSGGIGPGDAARILDLDHPMLTGIDLNSRFETRPGIKDVGLLSSFIQAIRTHELSR